MRYYKLVFDHDNADNYIFAEPIERAKNEYAIYHGKIINDWKELKFDCDLHEGNIVTDNLINSYGWPIFSERALQLLGDIIADDVQLLPISVLDRETGEEMGKYSVINVLPMINALDLDNATYFTLTNGDLSVMKYALRKDKLGEHNIFRLSESHFALFVSEKFKKITAKSKMLGFDFWEVKAF